MCFSPEVDFLTSVGVGVIAIATLRRVKENQDSCGHLLPIAVIPAIFALHLISSGLVWLGFQGHVPGSVHVFAFNFYVVVAFVLWPIYVPFALLCLRLSASRQVMMIVILLLGGIVAVRYGLAIINGHASVTMESRYLDFHISNVPGFIGYAYFICTCGAVLLSERASLVMWGAVNLIVVATLVGTHNHGLPSLWCFWAAVTSVGIFGFIHQESKTVI